MTGLEKIRTGHGRFVDRVIIFGRYPIPGKTKTRLAPVLGPAGAAELQRVLTEGILQTASAFSSNGKADIVFCFEGGSKEQVVRWIGRDVPCSRQNPGDLGERMYAALRNAFKKGRRRVVLVGTDIPALTPLHLATAFDALKENDIVVGPSTDGGYWLIGMKQPCDLFSHVSWSTPVVLEETLGKAKSQGLKVRLLHTLRDIDTFEDLIQLGLEGKIKKPYVSVVLPALNEAENVAAAIESAQCPDSQVIVVDGGSSDATAQKASDAGALVLRSSRGRALQQNKGGEIAVGSVLLFLHADTRLPRGYVNHVFEVLMDRSVAAGAFLFRSEINHPFIKFIETMTNLRSRCLRLPYGDQALFLRKETFQSVGGFPDVPIAEDLYLVSRLSKAGKIRLAPAHILTSGRQWQKIGIFRNSLINILIAASCAMGISPHTTKRIFRGGERALEGAQGDQGFPWRTTR
ncbi:MAG: TIGR04283 family arsenosugar biosynthesis glycosyltransferase [Deltaproteobacteria bacterium]|nr:TIGR04283 family arsenosugar biosynthesis glycosyltransferase [Deltaproteobacteria bacterium]